MATKYVSKSGYIEATSLYEWSQKCFAGFQKYKEWVVANPEKVRAWDEERNFALSQSMMAGLVKSASGGNAAAAKTVLDITRNSAVGSKPTNKDAIAKMKEEAEAKRDKEDFETDSQRLMEMANEK